MICSEEINCACGGVAAVPIHSPWTMNEPLTHPSDRPRAEFCQFPHPRRHVKQQPISQRQPNSPSNCITPNPDCLHFGTHLSFGARCYTLLGSFIVAFCGPYNTFNSFVIYKATWKFSECEWNFDWKFHWSFIVRTFTVWNFFILRLGTFIGHLNFYYYLELHRLELSLLFGALMRDFFLSLFLFLELS